MASNPLTLIVPVKQDGDTQFKIAAAQKLFIPLVQAGLDESGILHYASLSLIPNPPKDGPGTYALLLSTVFDGAMEPYLKYFWENEGTKKAFQGIAEAALIAPNPPVVDADSFVAFIKANNYSESGDLYRAYPQSTKEIKAAFDDDKA